MSKLDDLYDSIDKLENLGLVTDDMKKAFDEFEEDLIKDEVIPSLKESVTPLLNRIRRDIVLVVEYHPGEELSVALSRKVKISQIADAKTLTENVSTPVSSGRPAPKPDDPNQRKPRSVSNGIRVLFPDGTVICHNTAIKTFVDAIRKIGFEKVAQAKIMHGGYNLVSLKMKPLVDGRIYQHEADGYYVWSLIPNYTKIADLEQLSEIYNLGLVIETEDNSRKVAQSGIDNELLSEGIVVRHTKESFFARGVFNYFYEEYGLDNLKQYFEKHKLIKLYKEGEFSLIGLFCDESAQRITERNSVADSNGRITKRWFDDPYKIDGKDYYLTTQWTNDNTNHVSIIELQKMIKVCFDEGYEIRKNDDGNYELIIN